jgi:hypothetical protein
MAITRRRLLGMLASGVATSVPGIHLARAQAKVFRVGLLSN